MTSSRPTRRPRRRSGPSNSTSRPRAEELSPVEDVPDIKSFRELDLSEDVQEVIASMGITEPTPIQKLAINPVLAGRDVIAKAETGTGKTLAFGAPMMTRIEADRATVLGLVLCPTRELAQQVWQVLVELGKPSGVKVALVVGGDPMHPQVEALRDGAQVVVGTPGRVLDLYNQRFLSFPWTEFAILDEADEMLEIGFIDDVRKILDFCPDERQTLLFSATFPPELLRLARDHTKDPVEVATAKGVVSVENITHYVTRVDEADRPNALKRLIGATGDDDVLLVFCDRRVEVERVMRSLERTRWNIKALHGGYDQAARFRVMSAFREGNVKVLVATDVAARGLDIKHVTHVINYSAPRSITAYTHRSGRTGRAGRTGAAMTIVTPADGRRWNDLIRQMTWEVEDFDEIQRERGQSREPERSRSRNEGPGERGSRGGREARTGERGRGARGESSTRSRRRGAEGEPPRPRRTESEAGSEDTAERRPRRRRAGRESGQVREPREAAAEEPREAAAKEPREAAAREQRPRRESRGGRRDGGERPQRAVSGAPESSAARPERRESGGRSERGDSERPQRKRGERPQRPSERETPPPRKSGPGSGGGFGAGL